MRAQHFYDGLDRLTGIDYSDDTPEITYSYDQQHAGYQNTGRLTQVSTAAVGGTPQTIQAFDYDQMGRVAKQVQTVGANAYTLLYSHGLADQLLSQQYPSGKVVNHTYDRALRLTSVMNGSSQQPYANNYSYAAHGGILSETLGNGAVQSYSYNSRLQLSQITSGITLPSQLVGEGIHRALAGILMAS